MIFFNDVDIVNLLLKNKRPPNVVVFVVWSALIVGGWVVMTWVESII